MKSYSVTIILLSFVVVFSCRKQKNDNKENDDLIINLELKAQDNPMLRMHKSFRFMDTIPKHFKGIVNKDSSFVGYINTVDLEEYDKFLRQKNAVPNYNPDSIATRIYCLSGYENGKQFYILDSNANYDFSDEEVVEFDKSITHETKTDEKIRNSFPIHKMKIDKLGNNGIYGDSIYISLFPNINYYTYGKPSTTIKESLQRKLLVTARFIDYSYGTFSILDKKYKVAMGKYDMRGVNMIFSEYDSVFKKHNEIGREEYKLLDTLKLGQYYYRIEELVSTPSKLRLKKLHIKEKIYGFRKGNVVKNYLLEDLDGNTTALKNLFEEKEIILLDFWGTWCAPCKELTPELVALKNRYSKKINLVSLAYEKNPIPVKEYVSKNGMDWYQGIIKGKPKSGNNNSNIISDLRVKNYPTFIILDTDFKILFRGDGNTFKEMKTFLNEHYSY